MNVNLTNEEILFIYGHLKKELDLMKNIKSVKHSKRELTFCEELIDKLEAALPGITRLPL